MSDDLYGMSDDDFMNANHNDLDGSNDEVEAQEEAVTPEAETEATEPEVDTATEVDLNTTEEPVVEEQTNDEQIEEVTNETETQTTEVTGPLYTFKAAGRDVEVQDEAEAEKLMQMGVDYYEKMRAFKPHRKTLKTLENNEITEEDINLLIELKKGNTEAISKLVRDHKVDVHELDIDEESTYTPSNHTVSDTEVELDEVISRIQETDSFTDTMKVVNDQWDESSKRSLVAAPQLLENLNTHLANGTFKQVMGEVTRQRMFGGLSNISDLEAYNQVGANMQQQGVFNANAQQTKQVSSAPIGSKADKVRQDKRRKASPPKGTQRQTTKKAVIDPISMSDEEFMKLYS